MDPEESLATFVQIQTIDDPNNRDMLVNGFIKEDERYYKWLMNFDFINHETMFPNTIETKCLIASLFSICSMNNGILEKLTEAEDDFLQFDFQSFFEQQSPNVLFKELLRDFNGLETDSEKRRFIAEISRNTISEDLAKQALDLFAKKSGAFLSRIKRIRSTRCNLAYDSVDKVLDNTIIEFNSEYAPNSPPKTFQKMRAQVHPRIEIRKKEGLILFPIIENDTVKHLIYRGHILVDGSLLELGRNGDDLEIRITIAATGGKERVKLESNVDRIPDLYFDDTIYCLDLSFFDKTGFCSIDSRFSQHNSFFSEDMTMYSIKTMLVPELARHGVYRYAYITPREEHFRGISYLLIQKYESGNVIILPVLDEFCKFDGNVRGGMSSLIDFIDENFPSSFTYSSDFHGELFDNYKNILRYSILLDRNR
ncbi:hypothetical protein JCM17961_38910 [Endothiovibrio diazotrophicus]